MKKLFVFFALLAGIAVMTGCQKEQDVVTLKAVIDQNTKAYFGGSTDDDGRPNLPYWESGDEIYVAGQGITPGTYGLSFPDDDDYQITTYATIEGVSPSPVYYAIYPASAAREITLDDNGTPTATIFFEPHQDYIWVGNETTGHQRLNMPMGAVATRTTSGTATLYFKNLCSILRVKVTNALASNNNIENVNFNVRRITVQSYGDYVTGYAKATLTEGGNPTMTTNSVFNGRDNVLSFYAPGHASMGTIYYSNANDNPTSKSYDIVVPPFHATKLVLEVELYNGNNKLGYFEYTVENPAEVAHNNILPIDLDVNQYTAYDYAYFEKGSDFNADISALSGFNNVTTINFTNYEGGIRELEAGNPNYTWTTVHAANSPLPIYAYIHSSAPATLVVNSRATFMYADSNCSGMFAYLTNLRTISWNNINTTTGLPCGFQTEDVTNMSSMFEGCSSLQTITGINNFNTTNVWNMAHMFDGCHALGVGGLDLSNFHTHSVKNAGMVAMFKDCSSMDDFLNLSGFTTELVTDMSQLFMGCSKLKDITIDNEDFVISDGTDITNMCSGLASSTTISQWDRCAIRCSDNVKDALLSQDDNNNYISGIDRLKVYFPVQGENNQGQLTK